MLSKGIKSLLTKVAVLLLLLSCHLVPFSLVRGQTRDSLFDIDDVPGVDDWLASEGNFGSVPRVVLKMRKDDRSILVGSTLFIANDSTLVLLSASHKVNRRYV